MFLYEKFLYIILHKILYIICPKICIDRPAISFVNRAHNNFIKIASPSLVSRWARLVELRKIYLPR